MSRIAFIGLGTMGQPMSGHLLRAGHAVTGFDPNPAARKAFVKAGGTAVTSIAEAVEQAEFVITMLPSDAVSRQAYLGPDGILAHCAGGAVLAECSTISADTARELSAAAQDAGRQLGMVDAPVSGAHAAALAGRLIFMIGGEAVVTERLRPVLMDMGREVVLVGPSGAGQLAKICNNVLTGIHVAAAAESMALGQRMGLDLAVLREIISKSSGGSWVMDNYCPVSGIVAHAPSSNGYRPGFATRLMSKDVGLFQATALNAGLPTPMASAARAMFQLAANNDLADRDCSIVFELIGGRNPDGKDLT